MTDVKELCKAAAEASGQLAALNAEEKNGILKAVAKKLLEKTPEILAANRKDLDNNSGLSEQMLERLTLNEKRIQDMIQGVQDLIKLDDPVGIVLEKRKTAKGLKITKISVPLGVVGIIFESRPNVSLDTAVLCIKSGNAVILRGGKEAIESNTAITDAVREAVKECGYNENIVCLIKDTSRKSAIDLMTCNEYLDVIVPRGSQSLIKAAVENATVPVIETGTGNCHVYIESTADISQAVKILINAKTSRVSVCNSCESLIIDRKLSGELPLILDELTLKGVEIVGSDEVCKVYPKAKRATEEDYYTEFLSLKISVAITEDYKEAVERINKYGTKHSEAIITSNAKAAEYFQKYVDAAAVYVNVSTRFTDGYEFGLGAELGISTQKLHARGPVGLKELTSYKYLIEGDNLIR